MKKKKKGNIILKILAFLFIIYVALLIANMSGYYEAKVRDKVEITEEGIKEFETAIKNGEDIDINSFLKIENNDYSSKMSKLGDNVTNIIERGLEKSMKIVGSILKSLF